MKNKQIKEFVTESIGWIGVLLILCAYGLLTFEVVMSDSLWFHGLNLIGGVGIIIDAAADRNWQPAVLNVMWIVIAVYAISRIVL